MKKKPVHAFPNHFATYKLKLAEAMTMGLKQFEKDFQEISEDAFNLDLTVREALVLIEGTRVDSCDDFERKLQVLINVAEISAQNESENADWDAVVRTLISAKEILLKRTGN